MARGNARMTIFHDDVEYERFLSLLGEAVDRWRLVCGAYCLMPNHYHLLVRTDEPHLSSAMRHLNGVYAQWFNRRHARVGHVMQGRFKAQVIQRPRYLLAASRYIVRNPMRSGMVERPGEWPWSSYRATVGLSASPCWLSPSVVLDVCTDGEQGDAAGRFAALVTGPDIEPDSDDAAAQQAFRLDTRVFGEPIYTAIFSPEAANAPRGIPLRERRLGRPPLALIVDPASAGAQLVAEVRRAHDGFGYRYSEVARHVGMHREALRRVLIAAGRAISPVRPAEERAPAHPR